MATELDGDPSFVGLVFQAGLVAWILNVDDWRAWVFVFFLACWAALSE